MLKRCVLAVLITLGVALQADAALMRWTFDGTVTEVGEAFQGVTVGDPWSLSVTIDTAQSNHCGDGAVGELYYYTDTRIAVGSHTYTDGGGPLTLSEDTCELTRRGGILRGWNLASDGGPDGEEMSLFTPMSGDGVPSTLGTWGTFTLVLYARPSLLIGAIQSSAIAPLQPLSSRPRTLPVEDEPVGIPEPTIATLLIVGLSVRRLFR